MANLDDLRVEHETFLRQVQRGRQRKTLYHNTRVRSFLWDF